MPDDDPRSNALYDMWAEWMVVHGVVLQPLPVEWATVQVPGSGVVRLLLTLNIPAMNYTTGIVETIAVRHVFNMN